MLTSTAKVRIAPTTNRKILKPMPTFCFPLDAVPQWSESPFGRLLRPLTGRNCGQQQDVTDHPRQTPDASVDLHPPTQLRYGSARATFHGNAPAHQRLNPAPSDPWPTPMTPQPGRLAELSFAAAGPSQTSPDHLRPAQTHSTTCAPTVVAEPLISRNGGRLRALSRSSYVADRHLITGLLPKV